jgi:phage N-6-adenine-methyltransferase
VTSAYMPVSKSDDWATPKDLFNKLHAQYNFTLDAAASQSNHLCDKWFGLDHEDTSRRDGLSGDWEMENVWLNPPYGRVIAQWAKKSYEHYQSGGKVIMLLPSRTDTKWFHDYCTKGEIEFIKGRLKFGNNPNSAPFPSMLVRFL